MTCLTVLSGDRFLATALAHVDCQAKVMGSYGYGALADPASGVSLALASLLTIFVAVFGIRLLLDYPTAGRDVINDILKVGIVLTLATSWPAWRILGYDLVIDGPLEVARAIGVGSGLPGSSGDLSSRLQRVDNGLAALNIFGSGRLGVAQGDWFQLGLARGAYLTGTLAPLALTRLMTGILLAIAPLMAGLILFGVTRSLFVGWAKGLVAVFLSSLSLTLVNCAQLALIEPWLQDALQRRQTEQQILDAPVEIVVITLAFALVALGVLALSARIAFYPGEWATVFFSAPSKSPGDKSPIKRHPRELGARGSDAPPYASSVVSAVTEALRRSERFTTLRSMGVAEQAPQLAASARGRQVPGPADVLGSSYRRGARRVSAANKRRDEAR